MITGTGREVLIWPKSNASSAEAARATAQLRSAYQSSGWIYESHGKNGHIDSFNLTREGSPRRVIMGFLMSSRDSLICALLEVKSPLASEDASRPSSNAPAKILTAARDANSINVMGNDMPPMPAFPTLRPAPGKVRGYVKDWSGKPLANAEIGIRASHFAGYYSGGQGKTDANGYYELSPPKGMAHFYNAGYQIEWGDGVAAVSLHPADGKLESFLTSDGVVENFVLLPYGITNRENLQDSPHLPSTFYGGAIYFNWYGVEASDQNAPNFAVKEGSLLEVVLTPEGKTIDGSTRQKIIIRKTLGPSGGFRIHNIPLGHYRISVKANGKPLKISDTQKTAQSFGLSPSEAIGEAGILFVPDTAKASMVAPQHGAWKWVSLNLETP